MNMLTIAALLAGAMMLTWVIAAAEPAYAKQDLLGGEPAKKQDLLGGEPSSKVKAEPLPPGIGTSPKSAP